MDAVVRELKRVKSNKYRPENWVNQISIETGYSESLVKKVFHCTRNNNTVALAIITYFKSEEKKLVQKINKIKKKYKI